MLQILNIFSSFALFGLIWCIQLVHYPLFDRLEQSKFMSHMNFHKQRISIIVVPLMLMELISSGILAFGDGWIGTLNLIGFLVVIAIWLVTFFVQVPIHGKLSNGFDEGSVKRLVRSNWIRTFLWSIKSGISLYVLYLLI